MGNDCSTRNRSFNCLSLLCAAALMISLGGCATTVKTVKKSPAKNPAAAELRRVSIVGFEGRYADEVNVSFETALVTHQFDNQPYFTVVDRAKTKEVMREFKNSLGGEVDPSTAVRFGKKVGANGIYFGDITNASLGSNTVKRSKRYCKKYKKDGEKCKDYGSRDVNCKQRTATMTLVPRLINVESGQIVYRGEYTGKISSTTCPGSTAQSDSTLVSRAIDSAIEQILVDIAPSSSLVSVALLEKPSNLTGAEAADFQSGLEFSKAERVDRGCKIWRDLNRRVQGSDNALLYNVAVCEELDGNFEQSLDMYRQVDNRLTKPDNKVSDAIARVESTLGANR